MTLGTVLGVLLIILLADALFLEGRVRRWAWRRMRRSGGGKY